MIDFKIKIVLSRLGLYGFMAVSLTAIFREPRALICAGFLLYTVVEMLSDDAI